MAPAPYFGYATFDNGRLLATSNPDLEPETANSHEVRVGFEHVGCKTVSQNVRRHLSRDTGFFNRVP